MKVLTSPVCKSGERVSEGGMDSFIMLSSTGDVKSESVVSPRSHKTTTGNVSPTENINHKRWKGLFGMIQKKGLRPTVSPEPKSALFGQPLSHVFVDKDTPPKPITEMLVLLCRDGPSVEGVFRRAGNARVMRETKEQLNSGAQVDFSEKPTLLLAALLKDFLREIPGGLLMEELYQAWMTALATDNIADRCRETKKVMEQLPEENIVLLRHLVFMLHHISQNAQENKMNSNNLAVCVAPNLLQSDQVEKTKKVTELTEFLIDNYCEVFGERLCYLLGDSEEEELNDYQDCLSPLQHDSAYETDADGERGSCLHLVSPGLTNGNSSSSSSSERLSSSTPTPAQETFNTFTTKPFIRRQSEPAITRPQQQQQGARRPQPTLTRSHTDFLLRTEGLGLGLGGGEGERCFCQGMQLRKQISDECMLQSIQRRSLDCSLAGGSHAHMPSSSFTSSFTSSSSSSPIHSSSLSQSCPCCCCSSCSLESSCYSSASESSIFAGSPANSPPCQRRSVRSDKPTLTLTSTSTSTSTSTLTSPQHQDRQEKPHGPVAHRRSQSVRYTANKNRPNAQLRRGGSSRVARRDSSTNAAAGLLSDTLREDSVEAWHRSKPVVLSSAEVFKQVDSRIPGPPPSYQQATQRHCNPFTCSVSACQSLTVQEAMCSQTQTTGLGGAAYSANQSHPDSVATVKDTLVGNAMGHHGPTTRSVVAAVSGGAVCRARSISESVYKAPVKRVVRRCSQPVFEELLHARESYV